MLAPQEFATVIATHDFDPAALGLNRAKSRTLLVFKGNFKINTKCTMNFSYSMYVWLYLAMMSFYTF